MPVRILIADDHEVVSRGIRALLEMQPECSVVGEAVSGRHAVEEAKRLTPDVVVMDITVPDMNGLEATRQIRKVAPGAEVLVLSVHDSEQLVHELLEAGARGYVSKADAGRDLVAAIETLSRHRPFFTARVSEIMLEGILKRRIGGDPSLSTVSPLTAREREIVQLLAEGKSNKEVAEILVISPRTVETHRSNIMAKLKLHSIGDLVRYAIRNNFVQP